MWNLWHSFPIFFFHSNLWEMYWQDVYTQKKTPKWDDLRSKWMNFQLASDRIQFQVSLHNWRTNEWKYSANQSHNILDVYRSNWTFFYGLFRHFYTHILSAEHTVGFYLQFPGLDNYTNYSVWDAVAYSCRNRSNHKQIDRNQFRNLIRFPRHNMKTIVHFCSKQNFLHFIGEFSHFPHAYEFIYHFAWIVSMVM